MDKLGVQLPLLLTQIVNFTIMLLILTKLLYKPILKALKARKEKIAQGLSYTDKMQQAEVDLARKNEAILQKARLEAKAILEQAKKDALVAKQEIMADGKEEIEEMKSKMEHDLDAKLDEAMEEMSAKTVEIAYEMSKKALAGIMTSTEQHRLIEATLRKIEKSHEK